MSIGENHPRQGHRHINYPEMDNPIMVPADVDVTNPTPPGNFSMQGPTIFTTTASGGAPTPQETVTTGSSFIRNTLQGFGLSQSASTLIQESWRPGTRVQYDSLLRGWQGFCSARKIHPLSPTNYLRCDSIFD